jgi:threonine synthase
MLGFQAAGASPLVLGRPVPNPETIATAIRIGNPASWEGAIRARDESGGLVEAVTDQEILEAYRLLASLEGIFAEPASAASVAGLVKLNRTGRLAHYSRVVCVLTGHGLKDPGIAMEMAVRPEEVPAALGAVAKALGLDRGGAS